jgi:3-hydroxyacyl-CoA dehydrogenase
MKAEGLLPDWVNDMLASSKSFYTIKRVYFYNIPTKTQTKIPGQDSFIILNNIRESKKVWSNSGAIITDLGDGILNLEFQSK